MKKHSDNLPGVELRRQAEAKLSERKIKATAPSATETDTRRLVHELEVHQIELEMQNEELVQARTEAETFLRQYIDLYDYAPVGYCTLARDAEIHQVNLAMAKLLGVERGELINRRFGVFVAVESRSVFNAFFERALSAGGRKETCEVALQKDGNEPLWLHIEAIAEDEQREVCRVVAVDITERKRTEETSKLDERVKSELLARLNEAQVLALTGSWEWDLKTDHVWWSDETYRIFGVTQQDFVPSFEANGKLIHPDDFAKYNKLFEHSLQTGEPLDCDLRLVTNYGVLKHCHAKGKIIVNDSGEQIRFVGTIMDITERKRAEEEMRQSERSLRRFYESGLIGVIYWNMNGQITDANNKFLEMVGYTRDDLAAGVIDWAAMTPPEFRHLDVASIEELKVTGLNKTPFEKEYIRKDGTRVPIYIAGAMLDEKRFNGVAFVLDITERKRMEESLRAMTSRQEGILSAVPDIIVEVDVNKVYTWSNQSGYEFFGDDVIGKEAAFYFEGEQDIYKKVQPVFDGIESIIYLESWQRRKDGQKRLLGWWCKVLKDEKGHVAGALSTARDITESKKLEMAIAESEKRFRNIFEHASVGKSITFPDGGMKVNEAFCDMLGYSKEELAKLKWPNITFPEDVDRDQETVKAIMAGGKDSGRWQKRYIHKEGNIVWADVATVLQRDSAGNPLYFITTIVDITERKRAEEALRNSEVKFRSIFENMAAASCFDKVIYRDGIAVDYRVLDVNPAYERILGISRGDVIGKLASEIYKTDAIPFFDVYARVAETGVPETFESFFAPSGIFLQINVSRPAPGMFSTVFTDITGRRRTEETILHQLEELRRWQEVTLGREDRNRQLKHEVNELRVRLGEPIRYPSQESGAANDLANEGP